MHQKSIFDLIIVGAGPAGISTAIEAKKAGLRYCVLEKGAIVNSIQNFPTGMAFFSTPELLEIGEIPFTSSQMRPTRAEGLEYYTRVTGFYSLDIKLFENVKTIKKENESFSISTSKGEYQSMNVVLATGYYDNPNMLGIPGEELSKVSHYYSEPYRFFHQNIMIIGAKNSAAIAALELFRHGANVTLIHRGEKLSEKIKYWILPDIENRIKEGSIKAFFNTSATAITTDSVRVKNHNGEEFDIKNDFVFVMTGYHPDYEFLQKIGLTLDPESMAPLHNQETYETHIKGLYLSGSLVAGKNNNQIFIENGRLHGKKIIEKIVNSRIA